MPQPDFVQKNVEDQVRITETLPVPQEWFTDRPAEIKGIRQPVGKLMGNAGPDQGYGIKLAKTFKAKITLAPREHFADAMAGVLPVALKRASTFGRAPVIHDFFLAYTLFGFLEDAPADLIEMRTQLFSEASHHYDLQREIADMVPESTLRLTPEQVAGRLSDWKALLTLAE